MSGNPFEYINSINYKKPMKLGTEYSPFLTIRFFSYFIDTIHYADEINFYSGDVDNSVVQFHNEMNYTYLYHTVKARKRSSKWFKSQKDSDIEMIAEFYQCSPTKAKEYKAMLSEDHLKEISKWYDEIMKGI